MPNAVQQQVRLPMSVALGVVLQGIRIRLGRSLVTISGVVLGIAFLLSILAGQLVKKGVASEESLRVEVRRMIGFLTAESGPIRGKNIALNFQENDATLTPVERRFIAALRGEGANVVGPSSRSGVEIAAVFLETPDAAAVAGLSGADAPIAAVVRALRTDLHLPGVRLVPLARELREDEKRASEQAQRRDTARSIWIIIISLLVTVIGIANAMLMSVTERFREIGTMKCLGALSSFIRRVFLIESSLMGLFGGIAGAVFGSLVAIAAYSFTYGFGLVLSSISWGTLLLYILLGVVAGVVLSVIAAIYPADLASRMVPATALRSNI